MMRNYYLILVLCLSICACSKPSDPFEAFKNGDYKTARKGFALLSDQGNPVVLTHLGVIYHMGLGIERDLKKSFLYYKQAANQNHPPAQYNLGLLYQSGLGTEQDYSSAYKYFSLAADQNHRQAKLAAELLIIELRVR